MAQVLNERLSGYMHRHTLRMCLCVCACACACACVWLLLKTAPPDPTTSTTSQVPPQRRERAIPTHPASEHPTPTRTRVDTSHTRGLAHHARGWPCAPGLAMRSRSWSIASGVVRSRRVLADHAGGLLIASGSSPPQMTFRSPNPLPYTILLAQPLTFL